MRITLLAMLAFAGNSVLCRLALSPSSSSIIDPASFSAIRLLSGALTLLFIVLWRERRLPLKAGSWLEAGALFVYLVGFSYAYISLDTGVGALILFGVVQLIMLVAALRSGQGVSLGEACGLSLALLGLLILLLPGATSPSIAGALLMGMAGVGWALYTLAGRRAVAPLLTTCGNFLRALAFLPLLLLVPWVVPVQSFTVDGLGALLAVASGSVASALGYAIWYRALAGLGVTQAGVVQLSVPVLAALGGVWFVSEPLSLRLVLSSALVLGGIYLVLKARTLTKA